MKYLITTIISLTISFVAGAASKDKIPMKDQYGSGVAEAQAMKLDDAIANYSKYKGKKIIVEGEVKKVCKKKGCWMRVHSGNAEVRTLFKDYGFFVPKEILGKNIKLEGMLVEKELSLKEIRHFMKDDGKSAKEISKVTQPKKVFQFIAEGVQVL